MTKAMPGLPAPYTHASIDERRIMRKHAIPEHAYTGYVPKDDREPPDPKPVVGKIKHAIVGYGGHRHNKQDMIGTTFTHGLEVVPQPVRLQKPHAMAPPKKHLSMSASGYGGFDELSGYGQFLSPNQERGGVDAASGYGEMDEESHYGQFAAPPQPDGSTYGEFDQASKYGQFAPPPPASGYGKFDKTSGYGQFAPPPAASGYGNFAKTSGYGQFAPPPGSGYGKFDKTSGYGQFAPPPPESGYGKFDKMSGYGQFAPPPPASGYGKFQDTSNYGQFAPPPAASGYGNFEKASGYGQFAAPPEQPQPPISSIVKGKLQTGAAGHGHRPKSTSVNVHEAIGESPPPTIQFDDFCRNENLRELYGRVLRQIGGAAAVASLFQRLFSVLWQQKGSKTDAKKRVKVAFELVTSRDGKLDATGLSDALAKLSAVFTPEEVLAMFCTFDRSCSGRVLASHFVSVLYTELDK